MYRADTGKTPRFSNVLLPNVNNAARKFGIEVNGQERRGQEKRRNDHLDKFENESDWQRQPKISWTC